MIENIMTDSCEALFIYYLRNVLLKSINEDWEEVYLPEYCYVIIKYAYITY